MQERRPGAPQNQPVHHEYVTQPEREKEISRPHAGQRPIERPTDSDEEQTDPALSRHQNESLFSGIIHRLWPWQINWFYQKFKTVFAGVRRNVHNLNGGSAQNGAREGADTNEFLPA